MLGGINHQRGALHFQFAKSLAQRPRPCTPCSVARWADRNRRRRRRRHGARKRVVAAGIEHDELQLLRSVDRRHHLIQRHGFEQHVAVGGEFGVHRNQIIDAVHLDAVTRIIHHRPVRSVGCGGEAAQRLDHLVARHVDRQRHIVKADGAQCRRHFLRVAARIFQNGNRSVGGIADDQRRTAALLRRGRLRHGWRDHGCCDRRRRHRSRGRCPAGYGQDLRLRRAGRQGCKPRFRGLSGRFGDIAASGIFADRQRGAEFGLGALEIAHALERQAKPRVSGRKIGLETDGLVEIG